MITGKLGFEMEAGVTLSEGVGVMIGPERALNPTPDIPIWLLVAIKP